MQLTWYSYRTILLFYTEWKVPKETLYISLKSLWKENTFKGKEEVLEKNLKNG